MPAFPSLYFVYDLVLDENEMEKYNKCNEFNIYVTIRPRIVKWENDPNEETDKRDT